MAAHTLRSRLSLSVNAGKSNTVSGKLTPLFFLNRSTIEGGTRDGIGRGIRFQDLEGNQTIVE